jgi:hypothetical protein
MDQSALAKLIGAVKKKPISILRLSDADWQNLNDARNGVSAFSIARPHEALEIIKDSSLVLFFPRLADGIHANLGFVRSNRPVSTLESRIRVAPALPILPNDETEIIRVLIGRGDRASIEASFSETETVSLLSPSVSISLIEALSTSGQNERTLTVLARLLGPAAFENAAALQQDAIELALKVFGIQREPTAGRVVIASNSDTTILDLSLTYSPR